LLIARLLTGIGVGVVVSAGMASVIDLGGPTGQRQASLIASVAIVTGVGPLLAGGLAQAVRDPIPLIFAVEFVCLVTAAIVVAILPIGRPASATEPHRRFSLPSIPSFNRRHLAIGTGVFAPAITVTAFILSLGPSLLSHILGVSSPLIAGGMGGAIFFSATASQFAIQRLSVRRILLLGTTGTVSAILMLIVAVQLSSAGALILAAVLGGCGLGLGQLGGLTLIGLHVPPNRRAEAGAILNIGGYLPAGALPIATGFLIDHVGITRGTLDFAILLAVAAMIGGVQVLRRIAVEAAD
jgi:MFS family permease